MGAELAGPGGQIGLMAWGKEMRNGNSGSAHGLRPERAAYCSLPGALWAWHATVVRRAGQRPQARFGMTAHRSPLFLLHKRYKLGGVGVVCVFDCVLH